MAAPEGYKALGKIGISYKGDYNPNTVYERLDAVYHNGSTYLAIKDAPDGAPRNDKINWIYLAKGYDGETVDVADSEIAFTDSETRENITSGEKVSTVFGKVKKFFADLTAPAFAQMITTKEDLLATKVTGYVPDAKAVADAYTELNGKLQWIVASSWSDAVAKAQNDIQVLARLSAGSQNTEYAFNISLPNNLSTMNYVRNQGYCQSPTSYSVVQISYNINTCICTTYNIAGTEYKNSAELVFLYR